MMQGFLLRHSPEAPPASAMPRFSVQGARERDTRRIGQGYLESTVVGAGAPPCGVAYLCGHITNQQAVRRLLAERGRTVTDREDGAWLCDLYREYGASGFSLLDGLFVGALVCDGQLVLFSSKTPGPSLYYTLDAVARAVLVTTELKALPSAYRTLLPLTQILERSPAAQSHGTCLAGVRRVPAGHCVEIALDGTLGEQGRQYYSVLRGISLHDEQVAGARLRDVLARVVGSYPGDSAHCLVSGGLDSSIVAYLAQQRFERIKLFSLGSAGRNEFDKADALGRSLGLPVTRLLIDDAQFLTTLPEIIALTEHCFSTFAEYLVPVHLAHKQIGDSADIMLSGYGSDVLFAGFAKPGHSTRAVAELVESEYASTAWSNEASQCLGGAMGMEIGYPFFDSEVVDLAFAIDPYLKHKNGVEKYVLRQAFQGKINADVLWRPKVGIHEGTGCEDYFTGQLNGQNADGTRQLKDRLCYMALQQILEHGREPADIDMAALRRAVLDTIPLTC